MSATGPQNADGPQGPISDPRGSCKVHIQSWGVSSRSCAPSQRCGITGNGNLNFYTKSSWKVIALLVSSAAPYLGKKWPNLTIITIYLLL